MWSLTFFTFFVRLWCVNARTGSESDHERQFSLKVESPVFLAEHIGKVVTMNCPVKASIERMYKYIRRIKKGKELEYANRKLAQLLGLKYKWYKDGKPIRHHRSAWYMKLHNVQIHHSGIYTCQVLKANYGMARNFTLKVYKQSNRDLPILQTQSRNISTLAGGSITLECVCKTTKDRPQVRWLKWNADKLRLREFPNDIKTPMLAHFKKFYKPVDARNYKYFTVGRSRKKGTGKPFSYGFRLRLRNVKPENSGMYTCLVWNRFGRDHRNFFVSVKSMVGVAPYISNPKKMRRHFLAWPALSSTKLKCHVLGDRPLKYEWYKDGKKLMHRRLDPKINTSTWTLRLRELVLSDSGVYTCVVSNPFGILRHNITLKVIERTRSAPILYPNFPKNVSVSKGENTSFECIELVSGPLPDYRWYKWHSIPASYPKLDLQNRSQYVVINPIQYSAIRVKSGRSYRYGGRLTLSNITDKDAGLYTCVVRNHIGFDYSSGFLKLNDQDGPRFSPFVQRPFTINTPATETLKLDCNATGNPKPYVKWFKNGNSLATFGNQSDFMILSRYTLKLTNVLPHHSANYSCNVSNSKGSISHTFNVNVRERLFAKPIILPSVKQSMKLGGSYELKCTVISEKPLTVNWVRSMGRRGKDAVLASIPAKLDKYIYTYSYVISKVSSEDSGIYWCIARNSVGNSRRKFLVQVEV